MRSSTFTSSTTVCPTPQGWNWLARVLRAMPQYRPIPLAAVTGFDHKKTTRHFFPHTDGGAIEVTANSAGDTTDVRLRD